MKNNLKGDVDLSAVMSGADDMMWAQNSIVYYNHPVSEDGALKHGGDSIDGTVGEQITINLPTVSAKTTSIFAAISTKALDRFVKDPFFLSNLASATLKLVAHDDERAKVLCTYNLTDELNRNTAALVARLYRDGDGWGFEPLSSVLGEGKSINGLMDLLKKFSLWFRKGDLGDIILEKVAVAGAALVGSAAKPKQSYKAAAPVPAPAPRPSYKWLWWLLLLPLLGLLWWGVRSCSKPEVVVEQPAVVVDSSDFEIVTDTLQIGSPAALELFRDLMLHSIHFATNLADLKPDEKAFLGRVAKAMKDNPEIKILVRGHTDNVDTDAVNIPLSLERAQMVRDYLVNEGIDVTRLQVKGYGSSKPVDTNDTPEGRALNRRVDFAILK